MTPLGEKYHNLLHYLKGLKRAVVAFSGGADSTFLLSAAGSALGNQVLAVTIDAPYIPRRELREAKKLAGQYKISHQIIKLPLPTAVRNNPEDRCYHCKATFFALIRQETGKKGFRHIIEGTQRDDFGDYRPGLRALKELGILSPLKECGLSKTEVRGLSKQLNLQTWDKPAYSCLLTRIPYNTKITMNELSRIERSEDFLMGIGFSGVRVRSHGDLARIELSKDQRPRLCTGQVMDTIDRRLKDFGYAYVCFDLGGCQRGSFDPKEKR